MVNFEIIEAPPINLKTLSNVSVTTKLVIKTTVGIKNSNFSGHFVLAEAELSPSFDVILGLEFLNFHKFTVNCDKNLIKNEQVEAGWNFVRVDHSTGMEIMENNSYGIDSKGENNEINKLEINDNSMGISSESKSKKKINVMNNLENNDVKICNFTKLTARIQKGCTIPPKEKKYIKLKVDDEHKCLSNDLIVLLERNRNSKTFLFARSVSKIEDGNLCLALIWNITDDPLHLNKNMILANVEPVIQQQHEEYVNVIDNDRKKKINWEEKLDLNHLTDGEKTNLLNLLDKYKSVFAQSISDLGSCDIVQHEIHLSDNIPIRQKPYRVPYALKSEMKNQINQLLDAGIIQPSKTAYSAPVMLVKKADGSYRLVADLRKINEKTIPDNFPLPNLTEMVDMLSGAKYFTSMDLTSGFHQMKMHPSYAHLTGISTEFGLFEFKRMPFGLKNASSSFQRLMSIVLAGLSELQVSCYIDDVVVASKTVQEHLERLEIVFQRFTAANLKLKPSKCSFMQKQITYLGHTVKEGVVFPDTKNLNSIKKALPPQTKKQVRSFLGLTGFYRRFIPNYSKTALPLTNLTREETKFVWSESEQLAFETLRDCLASAPCLKLPDFTREFSISTDASNYALGAVLVQSDDEGFKHPVAFASRKLGPTEVKYSTVEKECLGVLFGITQFKNYVYGTKFTLYSDQQSLSKIKKFKDPTSRISRWLLTLQQYDFSIVHKPGRLNLMADYLSRAAYSVNKGEKKELVKEMHAIETQFLVTEINSIPTAQIIEQQQQDEFCKSIKAKLDSGFIFAPKSPKFFYRDGMLLCYRGKSDRHREKAKLVVPKTLIATVLNSCHDSKTVAHAGFSRTLKRIKEKFYWQKFYKGVKNYVASCHTCISRRGYSKNQKAPVQKIPTPNYPFEKVSFDAVGPFVTSMEGNKYLIVMTDYFTRYPEFTGKIPKNKLIEVGDVVYLNTPRIKVNTTKKLAKLNQGPFRVIAKTSPVVFKIKHINEPSNIQTVHLNRIFKVPERATFEWETSDNETPVDICPTAVQCVQTEEEILREFPPYTLPLEPGEYQDDITNESRRNNIVQTVSDGEQETSREQVLEGQGCEVVDGEVILIPSISNEEQVPIGELVVEVQTCNDEREDIQDVSV
ncbi:Retrovirus-related Pol polyprotein from transposon 297 [Araneus ventricosus]|uniref:RNA-directed DNA polymerase n=1 Tax=Araneus ventricosus TaxID=182803 RepID=A0A4Y2CS48_ARAVE|nr:Retrovirus-related Pol polyprotein from transposon 297 [Araneus ventricosus]